MDGRSCHQQARGAAHFHSVLASQFTIHGERGGRRSVAVMIRIISSSPHRKPMPASNARFGELSRNHAFAWYCETMRCVLKNEPIAAMALRMTMAYLPAAFAVLNIVRARCKPIAPLFGEGEALL